jgi:putative spermidine/putrescine transport system substrate-binding protein
MPEAEQPPVVDSPAGRPEVAAVNKPDAAEAPARALRVLSWGGAYGRAQEVAVFKALHSEFGFEVERAERAGRASVEIEADVVELDQLALLEGCQSGSLMRIEGLTLAAGEDGTPAAEDFLQGALSPCGVGTFAWSALFVVDEAAFRRRKPNNLQHVFDVGRYPGKRALIPSVSHLVVMAASAAGLPKDTLSEVLTTQDGADKVFEVLETIRSEIVWVDDAKTAIDMLNDKKAAIGMVFSGRLFRATLSGEWRPIWDGHVYDFASWAVRANTKLKTQAKTFIASATMPQLLAAQARQWPYGPMRISALPLADQHELLDVQLAPYMPTAPERLKAGVRLDPVFWSANRGYYEKRLKAFREGFTNGVRIPVPARRPTASRTIERAGSGRPVDG